MSWLSRNYHGHRPQGEEVVSIVTFHFSKRLEFPIVAILGIGYLPREKDNVIEDVRLMYVGMSRAMDRMVMTCHQASEFTVSLKSPFKFQ